MKFNEKIKLIIEKYYDNKLQKFAHEVGITARCADKYTKKVLPHLFTTVKIAKSVDISIDDLVDDDVDIKLKWNDRIKNKREKLNINMGELLNISADEYKKIETGEKRPNFFVLHKIARELNLNIEFLRYDY